MSGSVIAIDGPAASGKSTTAREVADRLGFRHVNSGLLYRAITWLALREGWEESDPGFGDRVAEVQIGWVEGPDGALSVEIEEETPGPALQSSRVAARVSRVSSLAPVRARVLQVLRAAARRYDLVCDGRDIGTEVFPEAPLKVFLVATPKERARRRLGDHGLETTPERIEEEAARLRARDEADSRRVLSPLRKAEDAVEIDTTDRSLEEVVECILDLWVRRAG